MCHNHHRPAASLAAHTTLPAPLPTPPLLPPPHPNTPFAAQLPQISITNTTTESPRRTNDQAARFQGAGVRSHIQSHKLVHMLAKLSWAPIACTCSALHYTSTPRVYSDSCPLSRGCHPTISPSVVPFSSHLQSLPNTYMHIISFNPHDSSMS